MEAKLHTLVQRDELQSSPAHLIEKGLERFFRSSRILSAENYRRCTGFVQEQASDRELVVVEEGRIRLIVINDFVAVRLESCSSPVDCIDHSRYDKQMFAQFPRRFALAIHDFGRERNHPAPKFAFENSSDFLVDHKGQIVVICPKISVDFLPSTHEKERRRRPVIHDLWADFEPSVAQAVGHLVNFWQ